MLILPPVGSGVRAERRIVMRELRALLRDTRWAIRIAIEVHGEILRDVLRGMAGR